MKPRRTQIEFDYACAYEGKPATWTWHFPGCGRLEMWDTNVPDSRDRAGAFGRTVIGYRYYLPRSRTPLFEGADYGMAATRDAIDSLNVAVGLLAFLTLDEDSGSECFETYTEEQLDWARNSPIREELAMFVYDHENPEAT